MEETFKESVIEKIAQIEKQVGSLSGNRVFVEEIRQQQKYLSEVMAELKLSLTQLNKNANIVLTASERMKNLEGKLEHYTQVLENPVERKEHHIHHFRWPLGVAIAVFLLLVVAVSALYVDHQKLEQYIVNDTKYRSLELMKDKTLQHHLYLSDSLYRADPDMRKQVLQQEEIQKMKLQLLLEAREKQQEVEELKRKAVNIK